MVQGQAGLAPCTARAAGERTQAGKQASHVALRCLVLPALPTGYYREAAPRGPLGRIRCDTVSHAATLPHVATLPRCDALSQEKKRLSETHSKATKTLKAKVGGPNCLMRPCFLTSDADFFLGRRDLSGLQLAALTAQVDDSLAREAQLQERLQVRGIHRFRTCTGTGLRAHSCHICNLTGLAPAHPYCTSAPLRE